jgi:hypothetical protein
MINDMKVKKSGGSSLKLEIITKHSCTLQDTIASTYYINSLS